jgi:flagellar biosynthesis regulator FlbT
MQGVHKSNPAGKNDKFIAFQKKTDSNLATWKKKYINADEKTKSAMVKSKYYSYFEAFKMERLMHTMKGPKDSSGKK